MKNVELNKKDIEKQTPTLRKFLIALGMIFPLVGASSADSRLKNDEFVMFLPDISYVNAQGQTVAGIQAWVYEKEKRRGLTRMLALFLGIDMSGLSPAKRRQLYDRTQLFRVDSERGKELSLRDDSGQIHKMPKTASNGRSQLVVPINVVSTSTIEQVEFSLVNAGASENADQAKAYFAPPQGLSVISDIDDTIKHSSVGDKKQLLINTFLEDFVAVSGMAQMYGDLNAKKNVAYHYVSSSPIQLYPVLNEFLKVNGYPAGTMHLREATRWTDIIPMPNASRGHKAASIDRILKAYPNRRFILIGDSSENDPTIYAQFMREYPAQIIAIIIRDVTPEKPKSDYTAIFKDLAPDSWLVTSSVDDMRKLIEIKKKD